MQRFLEQEKETKISTRNKLLISGTAGSVLFFVLIKNRRLNEGTLQTLLGVSIGMLIGGIALVVKERLNK